MQILGLQENTKQNSIIGKLTSHPKIHDLPCNVSDTNTDRKSKTKENLVIFHHVETTNSKNLFTYFQDCEPKKYPFRPEIPEHDLT